MTTNKKTGRHLDLGCGQHPRNPYGLSELYGVDISPQAGSGGGFDIRRANLAIEPIPFEDGFFNTVSAFDFIEHIPRQAIYPAEKSVRLPFIALMDEVWRVLKKDGLFYAVTPAYPSLQAFQDPTHVNFITEETHQYFCGETPAGRMYGFNGRFEVCRAHWALHKNTHSAEYTWRKSFRDWHWKHFKGGLSHFLWELRAVK